MDAAVETVTGQLIAEIEKVQADLEKHATDASLRNEWLEGRSPGLTAIERGLYLAFLLKELGPIERLAGVVSDLRKRVEGKPQEALVQRRLAALGLSE